MMSEGFSFSRELDFVRMQGLQRSTGRPAHEWDIYIIKELIDNALDADEKLWHSDPKQFPHVQVHVEYIRIPEEQCYQFFVQVSNRAKFPVNLINDIFATQWYTSRKAFIKGLTRGALGNALKTLLGIPYALHNCYAGDWNPAVKPLSILCDSIEYLPRYVVNSTAQTIQFEFETRDGKSTEGTVIHVGLAHFEQEVPRTLLDIKQLTEQYHLCNPHAYFYWKVEIEDQEWTVEYQANPYWTNKFLDVAPIQWYSPTSFQELQGALYRKRFGDNEKGDLPLDVICSRFAEFSKNADGTNRKQLSVANIIKKLGRDSIKPSDIEGHISFQLYQELCKDSSRFKSARLGAIGLEHIGALLTQALPVEGEIFYEISTDTGGDPSVPFVIEAVAAHLQKGKRHLWTALNFTPTYGDPFLNRWLRASIKPDEPVLGLRGILDIYEILDDVPVVLFLHIICPNIEHTDFSKTQINHLPFKEILGNTLDRLLTALRQVQEDEELQLEETVFKALDAILGELDEDEIFVFEQLLEKLRAQLEQESLLADWLERPNALNRLRDYISRYDSRKSAFTHRVAHSAVSTLSVPSHPDHHFSISTERISRDLLAQHHVNKLLYVQVRELEPIVIDNKWLCRMDMALLNNVGGSDGLQDALIQCVAGCDLPILILHDADETGCAVIEQMCAWLEEKQLDTARIVDVGLYTADRSADGIQRTRLVQMMPGELASWLLARFKAIGIPAKFQPSSDADIRRDVSRQFDHLLKGYLWEGMKQQFELAQLLADLDGQLGFTKTISTRALDRQIANLLEKEMCAESYASVLDKVVKEFFTNVLQEHEVVVQELVRTHLARIQDGHRQ